MEKVNDVDPDPSSLTKNNVAGPSAISDCCDGQRIATEPVVAVGKTCEQVTDPPDHASVGSMVG